MAKNIVFQNASTLTLPVASGVKSGQPVLVGKLPGVALTDRSAAETATVKIDGVAKLEVVSASGALAVGDPVYITSGGEITRTASGNDKFGTALNSLAASTAGVLNILIGK